MRSGLRQAYIYTYNGKAKGIESSLVCRARRARIWGEEARGIICGAAGGWGGLHVHFRTADRGHRAIDGAARGLEEELLEPALQRVRAGQHDERRVGACGQLVAHVPGDDLAVAVRHGVERGVRHDGEGNTRADPCSRAWMRLLCDDLPLSPTSDDQDLASFVFFYDICKDARPTNELTPYPARTLQFRFIITALITR